MRPDLPTILVVDDSVAIRRIIGRALGSAGYAVLEASNGAEAIEECHRSLPALVLLDVDMPVMDGLSTLRAMKANPSLGSVPVLFLTARTAGDDVAAGLGLGAQDYVRKPCEPAELLARVATALRLKAQQEQLERQACHLDRLTTTDPLTGVGNRRLFAARVEREGRRRSSDTSVGVAVVDADHFKAVNDEYGHVVGDLVLCCLADRLGAVLAERAPGATLARWGGEEFVVLVLDVDDEALAHLGDDLRLAMEKSPIALGDGRTVDLTISVGCAAGTLAEVTNVLARADAAVYRAKRAGRNRVEVHH